MSRKRYDQRSNYPKLSPGEIEDVVYRACEDKPCSFQYLVEKTGLPVSTVKKALGDLHAKHKLFKKRCGGSQLHCTATVLSLAKNTFCNFQLKDIK